MAIKHLKRGLEVWLKLVEHLPSNHEALSSNPRTTEKKKKPHKKIEI
jgi:hypothetical protein